MKALYLLMAVGALATAQRIVSAAELAGQVVDQQDRPVAGAIVVISTAKPRTGPAVTCPSCYRDCAKRTRTDADGRFRIDGLSSKLLFSLAAGATGHHGVVTDHHDPAENPMIEIALPIQPSEADAKIVVGRVVDPKGAPIAGAEVRSQLIRRDNGRMGGSDPSVSPLTLTDDDGEFQLPVGSHIRGIDLRVIASGFAPQDVNWERSVDEPIEVKLGRGASLQGRLVVDVAPLGSVEIGLVQLDRTMGNIVTPQEISTNADGVFQFDQLPPNLDYAIYTHTGQDSEGVLPVTLIKAPDDGELAILGDIPTLRPNKLSITVRTEDGQPLPPKSALYVGRRETWRGSVLNLPPLATAVVELNDVSAETFQISVRIPNHQVLETAPTISQDINRRYPIRIDGDTEVGFVVGKRE